MDEYPTVKLHEDSYLMLLEMAAEQDRALVKVLDRIIQAEWLRTHPQPITETESQERR